MEYRYKPQGVCSTEMIINVKDNIVEDIKIHHVQIKSQQHYKK